MFSDNLYIYLMDFLLLFSFSSLIKPITEQFLPILKVVSLPY